MKKVLLNIALYTGIVLVSVPVNARESVNKSGKTNSRVSASYKTEAGDCVTPTAQFDLSINNVRARLLTGGDMWWNLSSAKYEVPKGDGSAPPFTAIFAGAIWISGVDFGNNLKVAAQRFRDSGDDYWPGPLTNGTVDKATCSKYDRFFNVFGADILKAQAAFLEKGSATTVNDIPKDVLAWPGRRNQYLRSDPTLIGETFDIEDNLAPFYDADGDGEYDPVKGDHPVIPCRDGEAKAFGDQMIFWVLNDVGNIHSQTNAQSIGVQINALAFAFQTTDEINNMTFYKYEIVNKSANPLLQTYISQWSDPDLGCYNDDRVGCDTVRSLGICYNGVANDPGCNGESGYGSQLPAIGIDFFEGPLGDDSLHTQLGLTSFVYFTNGGPAGRSDPITAQQYRNYQTGFWGDGTPFTFGDDGYSGTVRTNFIFPGDPTDPNSWNEISAGIPQADRRMVQSSGPFTLNPNQPQYVTIGVVFVRPAGGVGLPPSFATTIGTADDKAQNLFLTCFKLLDGPDAPTLQIRELDSRLIINLVNLLGSSNNVGEGYDVVDRGVQQQVINLFGGDGDSTYTFEGYKLYQLAFPTVAATDLGDETKAKIVAQVDIKNGITSIINYSKDPALGILVPTFRIPERTDWIVEAADAGITTSFNITEDKFATGSNKSLINHKTYYYTAIAYAYNNYLPYDPAAPNENAQLLPYLQGRGNFKVYSAIPHITDPRNGGTVLNSEWGDGVEVKRIEGQGNGGNNLRLDEYTIEKILASDLYAFSDTLTYSKRYDPIGFKVTDPINLKEADFELQFVDNATNPVGATTRWFLHDLTNNDTIWSDRTIDRPYEQHIALIKDGERTDYGFSIKLGTPVVRYNIPANIPIVGLPVRHVYDPLPSSIEYEDPAKPWLSFVADEEGNTPTNWIRAGHEEAALTSGSNPNPLAGVYDDNWYYNPVNTPPSYPRVDSLNASNPGAWTDRDGVFENIINGTWAPYCLAANYSNKNASTGAPPYVYGPGFKWRNYQAAPTGQTPPLNNLDKLASVDIVITPDKSKWTRCIVFETGEDEAVTAGAEFAPNGRSPRKGQIRMHHSWDKDNNRYLDGSWGETPDTGRSWFPGYAINVETGERLNMAFGERSDLIDQNGNDMKWNPSPNVNSPIAGIPYFGGGHFIYVLASKYDEGAANQRLLLNNYNIQVANPQIIPTALRTVYLDLMWTSIPYLSRGYSFKDGYIPPAEVKVRLRIEKPFNRLTTSSTSGDPLPRYQFSTKGMGATEENKEVAKTACDLIRAVPNPYLAYSAYETDQNSSIVKITNLPNKSDITIYSLDGVIIRKLSRAIGNDPATNKKIEISDGNPALDINLSNSVEWDLKNQKGIPIAAGVYLIHVNAPGICERTIKWFGAVRPADASNF